MGKFRYIIFDLGNVLVNIHPEETMNRFASLCHKELSQVHPFFMSKIHLDFMCGKFSAEEFYNRFIRNYPCHLSFTQFISTWGELIGTAKEEMGNIIRDLKGKYTLSVCSNTDPLHWEIARKTCPFLNDFDHYFLSYRMKLLKPDPVIFQKMAAELSANPNECIFIDDTIENIVRAKKLGFYTILFRESGALRSELSKFKINILQQ